MAKINKYYINDDLCISCLVCTEYASANFSHNYQEDYTYINKQPLYKDEDRECKKALQICPVNAITTD
jgi:ferredoxin